MRAGYCAFCGVASSRTSCARCRAVKLTARAALAALIRSFFVERVGEHGYVIRPGAQEIAELMYASWDDVTERFLP